MKSSQLSHLFDAFVLVEVYLGRGTLHARGVLDQARVRELLLIVHDVHLGLADHVEVRAVHSDNDAAGGDAAGLVALGRRGREGVLVRIAVNNSITNLFPDIFSK